MPTATNVQPSQAAPDNIVTEQVGEALVNQFKEQAQPALYR